MGASYRAKVLGTPTMTKARQRIADHDYEGARRVLEGSTEPLAQIWLAELNRKRPAKRMSHRPNYVLIALVIFTTALLIYASLSIYYQGNQEAAQQERASLCTQEYRVYTDQWENCTRNP